MIGSKLTFAALGLIAALSLMPQDARAHRPGHQHDHRVVVVVKKPGYHRGHRHHRHCDHWHRSRYHHHRPGRVLTHVAADAIWRRAVRH